MFQQHKGRLKCLSIILFLSILNAGCGTLGGFNEVHFHISKKKLEIGIDSLYKIYPEYKMPLKWKEFDDWSKRGYDFLESRMFYFNSSPEEMYYVTFIGDSAMLADPSNVLIGIRAINKGSDNWYLNDDLDSKEKQRIIDRFGKEIIPKLEQFTNSKIVK